MENPVTKRLLFDFFSDKTTVIQRTLIEEWLSTAENQELYYKYLDEWESENPVFRPDLDNALHAYQSQLDGANVFSVETESDTRQLPVWSLRIWPRFVVAASVLIAACWFFQKDLMYETLQSPAGKTSKYMLSDGTQVILNANSTLRVSRFGFAEASREVELEGEADFDVTHTTDNKRFIVKMGDSYKIEVLGTKFVAYSRAARKRVLLSQGKVKLQLPAGKQVYMKPGNLFTSTSTDTFDISVPAKPQQYTAWKDQLFYFDDTPMLEVTRQMKERFDIDVRIADSVLLERHIGGIYRAENPDDLLEILTELLELEVVQNQNITELHTQNK
ncbi:FecR family protein [Dyadobacter sp. CY343]|uniref:FecR family protein n=1 Tax=Dyadobacter sp. CY343 TaxID=2907299 RepID=UPI001F17478B|nr:FecR domain-containing protein [Dyadobacter sp. CY343]MCE7059366.1 FecR domain-containing protein [Dyadobacter sp. CY343]